MRAPPLFVALVFAGLLVTSTHAMDRNNAYYDGRYSSRRSTSPSDADAAASSHFSYYSTAEELPAYRIRAERQAERQEYKEAKAREYHRNTDPFRINTDPNEAVQRVRDRHRLNPHADRTYNGFYERDDLEGPWQNTFRTNKDDLKVVEMTAGMEKLTVRTGSSGAGGGRGRRSVGSAYPSGSQTSRLTKPRGMATETRIGASRARGKQPATSMGEELGDGLEEAKTGMKGAWRALRRG